MNKQLLLKHISSEQEMMPFYINEPELLVNFIGK